MWKTSNDQLAALVRLYELAQGDHGGSNVAVKFLLGLYNGDRFPFDLTELRRLDIGNFEAVLEVLQMDFQPALEVHAQLALLLNVPRERMSHMFESWAHQWRLKGRCKKEDLEYLKARAYPEAMPC